MKSIFQVLAYQRCKGKILEQDYFDHGLLLVAMIKAGVELAYETMLQAGIVAESAYYESLHELPLIANTIARKRLYEINIVISDTAEYGNYLFSFAATPLLKDFMATLQPDDLAEKIPISHIDNRQLQGKKLRNYITDMKRIDAVRLK